MTDQTMSIEEDFAPRVAFRLPIRAPSAGLLAAVILAGGASVAAVEVVLRWSQEEAPVQDLPGPVASNPFGDLAPSLRAYGSLPTRRLALAMEEAQTAKQAPSSVAEPVESAPVESAAETPAPAPEPSLRASLEEAAPAAVKPTPPQRPSSLRRDFRRGQTQTADAAPVEPPSDNRNFFQKLFNVAPTETGPALAYARPEDEGIGSGLSTRAPLPDAAPSAVIDAQTAVYDISAKTVFMPNGEKLEAHSGLGSLLDDPKSVHVKMRGATPPNVYSLELRKQLFHGVQAIRLTPTNQSAMHGRDGILAHTFMLGPNGDSNGCVSFRDYPKFLQAFLNGQVKRMVVVARRA